jgi:hypothetical protein
MYKVLALTLDCFTARGEDMYPSALSQNLFYEGSGGFDDVLAIVQDQEQASSLQALDHRNL